MFKSLQWKMVTIFVLLILAVMTVAGTFLIASVTNFYHELFVSELDSVFNENVVARIESGAEGSSNYIKTALAVYSPNLGIDSYRNYYIFDRKTNELIGSSVETDGNEPEKTANYIAALAGSVGKKINLHSGFMDYAVPIETSSGGYVIYILDTKEELNLVLNQIFVIILQALMVGIVISLVLGYFLSKTITMPISNLTKNAKKMAEGDFDAKIDVNSNDEIGTLTEAFNDMSSKLQYTLYEISKEKNKVEALLINMTDGIIAFDTDGGIIHINPTAQKMLGINTDTSKIEFDTFFAALGVDIKLGDLVYIPEKRTIEKEINLPNASIIANFVNFDDELNHTAGVLTVLHDITKQQRLDEARREFVANVSHELRTPLTTLKSYSETLIDMVEDNPTAVSFTNTILNETDRMTRLVKDLLMLSSLEHVNEISGTVFDMKKLISDVVETLKLVASERGHRLSFSATTAIPEFYGDRDKIEQLLINIISNSIKYTPNGGKIEVFAGKLYSDVYIKVKDTGIGIPEKDLKRIFERFYRVDKARSRERGGTGLGLAISKSIVDSHGGSINISSAVGEGTEVIITLPCVAPPEEEF
ncbi:MAG: HAMP domain-containing protein [Clostridia bacterium]|nr:HAMP domain-containing protein [Clostridia bacterium]